MSCLTVIRRHLADAGRLILDLFNPSLDALVTRLQNEEFGDEPESSRLMVVEYGDDTRLSLTNGSTRSIRSS